MSKSTIGWIGLGKMGIPMSGHLIKAGYPVTVYNRSRGKETLLKELGAASASTPADLLKVSEIIFLMVSDDTATREIFQGADGLLSAAIPGRIVINMSTVSPTVSREMADACTKAGLHYVDAPVSGSVKQAQDGQLVIMAGGSESVIDSIKPILEHIGKLTLRVGETGAGNTAKLVINTLLGVYAQGLAEAVVLARRNGISTEDLLTLINNSALGNPLIKIKGEAILKENFDAAFALKHIVKDLNLAGDIGLDLPLGSLARDTFQQAAPQLGEEDIIAIIKRL